MRRVARLLREWALSDAGAIVTDDAGAIAASQRASRVIPYDARRIVAAFSPPGREERERSMSKGVAEWLREGEHLVQAGLAECRAIDDRIAQLERLRAERWSAVEAARRVLGRSPGGVSQRSAEGDAIAAPRRAPARSDSSRDALVAAKR